MFHQLVFAVLTALEVFIWFGMKSRKTAVL